MTGELDLVTEGDAAAGEIVGRDLDRHAVALQHADAKAAHVPAERRQYCVTVGERHAERGVRQHLGHRSFQLYRFFFCHSELLWETSAQKRRANVLEKQSALGLP